MRKKAKDRPCETRLRSHPFATGGGDDARDERERAAATRAWLRRLVDPTSSLHANGANFLEHYHALVDRVDVDVETLRRVLIHTGPHTTPSAW